MSAGSCLNGCGLPSCFRAEKQPSQKGATCGQKSLPFALLIIGLIGLVTVAVGLAGWGAHKSWWDAGSLLSSLGAKGSIVSIVVGSVVAMGAVVVAIKVKSNPKTNLNEMSQQLYRSITSKDPNDKALKSSRWRDLDLDIAQLKQKLLQLRPDCKMEKAHGLGWGSCMIPNIRSINILGMTSTNKVVEDSIGFHEFKLGETPVRFLGVFDGHSDKGLLSRYASEFFTSELPQKLQGLSLEHPDAVQRMLTDLCLECEEQAKQSCHDCEGGTTAIFILQIKDVIYTVNVGDSRAVLVKSQTPYQLSEDADLETLRFAEIVEEKGLTIMNHGGCLRVNGYNLAADLCNSELPLVSDVTCIKKDEATCISYEDKMATVGYEEGNYLVLASDGLWDVCSNNELAMAIDMLAKQGKSPEEMAEHLAFSARVSGSEDDITIIVVKL